MSTSLLVSEIFGPTIQGEGAQIGRPTVFVRLAGCDYRCSWCDSMYAVDPINKKDWKRMRATEVMAEVSRLSRGKPILVTLSGGNPALQNGVIDLLEIGQPQGFTFTMETQGSKVQAWFTLLNHLCISPKPPSSGMETDWTVLAECVHADPEQDTILKVVVFSLEDVAYAEKVHALFPHIPFYLQVGNVSPKQDQQANVDQMLQDLERLSMLCIERGLYDVHVLPQLHALMWGNKRAV